jgi:hypothetical protein
MTSRQAVIIYQIMPGGQLVRQHDARKRDSQGMGGNHMASRPKENVLPRHLGQELNLTSYCSSK